MEMEILDNIGYLFTITALSSFLVGAIFALISVYKAISFFFKREKRISDNLQNKKIIIFAPPKSSNNQKASRPEDMEMEIELLKKTDLFKHLPAQIYKNTSHEKLDAIKPNTLVIVGYNKYFSESSFLEILEKAKSLSVPLIFYAYKWLDPKSKAFKELKKYPYHSMCETGLRLVNDVFTTLATYPYGNK